MSVPLYYFKMISKLPMTMFLFPVELYVRLKSHINVYLNCFIFSQNCISTKCLNVRNEYLFPE